MSKIKKNKDFIKRLALDKFKERRHTNLKYDDLDVITINTNNNDSKCYEVFSIKENDAFRLRLYLTLSNYKSQLDDFVLRESEINTLTTTKSHVYVSEGFLERKFIWNEEYKEMELEPSDRTLYSFVLENGELLTTESNEVFFVEAA